MILTKIINILKNQTYAFSLYLRTIAGTIVLFIIARYLTVYDYGLFSSYKNIAAFCFMFANLGYAEYILVSSKTDIRKVQLKISMFLINSMFITVLICIGGFYSRFENILLFWLVVIRTFFDGTFFALILPYFQASKKFNVIASINIFYAISIIVIAIISYIFKLSLIQFLTLNILLGAINFIQCSFYAKINYFLFLNNIKRYIKMLDKSIFAYMGVTIAYFLYAQIPSLYVSMYIQKEQAALYFAAFTIATVVSLVINAQTQKLMPELIKASLIGVKTIIRKNLIFILSVTFALFVFIAIVGKYLLILLYGQQYYTMAYPVLLILMLGNIGIAEASVYGAYITASGNQKKKIPMQLEGCLITIVSLLIFCRFGIMGASISYLFASIFIAFRYTIFTINYIKNEEE